jgi:uncharacterized protein with FMN-binding domain
MVKHAGLVAFGGAVVGFAGVLLLHNGPPAPARIAQAGAPGAGTATASAKPATPASPVATGGPVATGPARQATGASEQYGYGTLAVRVTVQGSRIADISVATLQTAEPLSQQIADQAIPILRSEVLSAQGAQINGVSGATYTSEAYAASLQSALDKLHVK